MARMLLIHTARIVSAALVLLVTFSVEGSWFAQTGLTVMLMLLLIGGVVVLLVGVQSMERIIGFAQRKDFGVRANGDLRGDCHKVRSIFSCEVRDGANLSLAPKQFIRELRNIAHVNPAANHDSAFADRAQCLRHETPDGCEDDRRIHRFRRQGSRTSCPVRAEGPCEFLSFGITFACKYIDLPALKHRHLRNKVRGSAEAVNPKAPGVS